jgi:hypothetical protein
VEKVRYKSRGRRLIRRRVRRTPPKAMAYTKVISIISVVID